MAQQLSTNTFGDVKWIVATNAWEGTHTTLAGAIASASAGDTIFLKNSVTENVTLTPGVNITAWTGGTLNTPTITGTITMTGAGTSTISGLRLATNSAAIIAVTGSAASILNVNNCYLNMGSNAITYSSSSSSSAIYLNSCTGDITAGSTLMFAHSSAGTMSIRYCNIQNTGASTSPNTLSAGNLSLFNTLLSNPITTSGSTAGFASNFSLINCNTINVTALTHGCTNATASSSISSSYASGSASAISISASCAFNSVNDTVGSNNTNAVTGAGTITYTGMNFFGTSKIINTTTQTGGVTTGIVRSTGPSAGFIGEQLVGTLGSGSAVSLTNTTVTNIITLSLTAGTWDVSCLGCFGSVPTGFTGGTVSISETSATGGTLGNNAVATPYPPTSGGSLCLAIPSFRIQKASTSNVYLVMAGFFTGGTLNGFGRISATRVG
jgi:hypothetical protein